MKKRLTESIVVRGKAPELYKLWIHFEKASAFLDHLGILRKIEQTDRTKGRVRFTELPEDETEVTVTLDYESGRRTSPELLRRSFARRLWDDLRDFKGFAERTHSFAN
jgi:uncharacterized membrane protein